MFVLMKRCASCGKGFAPRQLVDGTIRSLYSRRHCLDCSPFGSHNTSRSPRIASRERRRASQRRYETKRKKALTSLALDAKGGRCEDCGYARCASALELHHRDPANKAFALRGTRRPPAAVLAELEKCVLLCANCHRRRHDGRALTEGVGAAVVRSRRRTKVRAVALLGGCCSACGFRSSLAALEFHHRDPRWKDFAISVDGVPRAWGRIVAELSKCVLLCANCHRELHAEIRGASQMAEKRTS